MRHVSKRCSSRGKNVDWLVQMAYDIHQLDHVLTACEAGLSSIMFFNAHNGIACVTTFNRLPHPAVDGALSRCAGQAAADFRLAARCWLRSK